ncbi:MAG: hypothetical protein AAB499_01290, partial [Patescibacteria group bacterium]
MKVWIWAIGLLGVIIMTSVWLTSVGSAWPAPANKSKNDNQEPVIQGLAGRSGSSPRIIVPILMYHYIRDYRNPDDYLGIQLSVSPKAFEEQLQALKSAGYYSISLEAMATGRYSLPPDRTANKP